MTTTEHAGAPARDGFGRWVLRESGSLYLRASVVIALAQFVNSMLADMLGRRTPAQVVVGLAGGAPRWLPVATHGFQLVMILILVLVLLRKAPAGLASSARERGLLLGLQDRFRRIWIRVWILWLLFYLGLFALAFLKQVEIESLSAALPRHLLPQYVWFNRMHESEDIKQFSETLAIRFDDIKSCIAYEVLDEAERRVTAEEEPPTSGKDLVAIGLGKNHDVWIRSFDAQGKLQFDSARMVPSSKDFEIDELKRICGRILGREEEPGRDLDRAEKNQILRALRSVLDPEGRPPWANLSLGIHDLPYFVKDDRQVELLKSIIYDVTVQEHREAHEPGPPTAGASPGREERAPGDAGRAGGARTDPGQGGRLPGGADEKELGEQLPGYLDRVAMVDRLTTTLKIERTLSNLLNNLQTWQILVCYLFLLRPRRDERFPYEFGVAIVAIIAVIETTLITTEVGGSTALEAFRVLSATSSAVIYALLVGRLESQALRAPLPLIVALYVYAALQMGWGIEPSNTLATVLNSTLFFSFAAFKLLMFLFVLWLLQSGMLLYYFHYRLHTDQTMEHSIDGFLKHVIPTTTPEAGGPAHRES